MGKEFRNLQMVISTKESMWMVNLVDSASIIGEMVVISRVYLKMV